jgi:hypothetical protein
MAIISGKSFLRISLSPNLSKNIAKYFVICGHTLGLQQFIFGQKVFAGLRKARSLFAVRVHNAGIHVFFSRFDLAPNCFVRHFHQFGGLIHRARLINMLQNLGPALPNDDVVVLIHNPLA